MSSTPVSSVAKIVTSIADLRREVHIARGHGRRIGFVPTMGYLHRGHVSLLEEARRQSDLVVLSIFVNPTQFGPNEDFSRYPRDLNGDLAHANSAGVDIVFCPEREALYPEGYQTFVEVRELEHGLCGDRRPGHFVGVATIVLKLFNIVQPHVAFFGEKDYQQLQVIRRMVRDLDLEVAVVGLPIVRDPDGLALSSRNTYLSPEERSRALALSRALFAVQDRFHAGEREAGVLVDAARGILAAEPEVRLDYLELRHAESLAPVSGRIEHPAVLAVAAFVGKTRLIDNVLLRPL
ncbi:MAG TPA: pantoate--beta-alanine ligase [Polyangia bacterium]|jgi:pantoate--beta-alanine ligase|nr:pantoate--beta-alanine ligase [Polyangia bacterium]